jgi:WD40 repeat protein
MPARLRLFISSPGDVFKERLRVELVVDRLAQDYRRYFTLETYRWEYEPMLATGHFQDSIEPPSAFDIVVLVVWSRLGTSLPADGKYRGIDGRAPVTGTEWEFEEALQGYRVDKKPDILAFRNMSPASFATADAHARARDVGQLDALDAFWKLHFADKNKFIGGHESYLTLEEFESRIELKLRKLIERRIAALAPAGPAPMRRAPFRGLRSYDFEDAEVYFGRDGLVGRAIERLAARARHDQAFLLVSGPSGSGKSSLVKAALVPRLMKPRRIEGASFLRHALFRPSAGGKDLFLGLAEALTREPSALPELLAPGQGAPELAVHLRESAGAPGFVFAGALGRVTERAQETGRLLKFERAKLILVVDQLEELVTGADMNEDERQAFARFLARLARAGDVWIIATLRDDFWPQIAKIADFVEIADGEGRLDVASPSPAEIAEIIRRPVQSAGVAYENDTTSGLGLDAMLAEEASAEPGVLPLLSFTLDALYAADVGEKGGSELTVDTYNALGGLRGAIAKRAEDIFGAQPLAAREALPHVLRALTAPGGAGAATVARPAPLRAFRPGTASRQIVEALLAARLLVASNERGEPTVRLAHEALLTRWDRAAAQTAIDRRDLETRKLIESQLSRWSDAAERDKHDLLLRDPDLASARDLARRWGDDLDRPIGDFISASSQAAGRAAFRRRAIAVMVIASLAVLTAASLGALAIAQRQRDDALISQSRGLIRDSRAAVATGDAARGLRLALAAAPPDLAHPNRPFLLDAADALADAYVNRRELAQFNDGDGELRSIAFSPDGQRLLSASDSGTARLWSVTSPTQPSLALPASKARLYAAVFSPYGARVVTASADGTARLWNAATGAPMGQPMIHKSDVVSVAFSPDGSRLVTGTLSGIAKLWDGATGAPSGDDISCGEDSPPTVAFSPDGKSRLTVSEAGGARLWDAATQKLSRTLNQGEETAEAAVFSPDGAKILVGAEDGVARLWDADTGALLHTLRGHGGRIVAVAFSPDGKHAATGAGDNSARIWNVETGDVEHVLLGHAGAIDAVAFSPDGRLLATASEDRTARLWDVGTGAPRAMLGAHAGAVQAVSFSPSGNQIATASRDATARLWNVEPLAFLASLPGGDGPVTRARFSRSGERALVVTEDGSARVWDVREGRQPTPLGALLTGVGIAELSADGNRIVAASPTGPTRLYDAGAAAPALNLGAKGAKSASFSPDGKLVLSLPIDGPPRLWDAATGADLGALADFSGSADLAVFSDDGRTIFAAAKGVVAGFWDSATRQAKARLADYVAPLETAAFSPDGGRLVTASLDKYARLWDVATGNSLAPPLPHANAVESAIFSSDGARVVTVSFDHTADVWDARSGARIARIEPRGNYNLWSAVFSPDGTRVAVGSDDETAQIWDAASGKLIATFPGHEGAVTSAVFSPDGARLLTASADGTARLWRAPPTCQALIDAARASVAPMANGPIPAAGAQSVLFALYDRAQPLLSFLSPRAGDDCR